jgi:hypothetical protein
MDWCPEWCRCYEGDLCTSDDDDVDAVEKMYDATLLIGVITALVMPGNKTVEVINAVGSMFQEWEGRQK